MPTRLLTLLLTHNMMFRPLRADQYLARLEFLAGSPELAQAVAERYPFVQPGKHCRHSCPQARMPVLGGAGLPQAHTRVARRHHNTW